MAFFDGQNLFHAAREAFGYTWPNYDVAKLATTGLDAGASGGYPVADPLRESAYQLSGAEQMIPRTVAGFVLFAAICHSTSALAVWTRAESMEWQTDLSDHVVIASVTATNPLEAENKVWDAQEVTCNPIESLKGAYRKEITFRHIFRNAQHPWEGSAPAIRVGQRILVFLVVSPDKKDQPFEWINLSQPNHHANALAPHTAYDNDCRLLADERSILTVVRDQVKKTAGIKNTKRCGVIVDFKSHSMCTWTLLSPQNQSTRGGFWRI